MLEQLIQKNKSARQLLYDHPSTRKSQFWRAPFSRKIDISRKIMNIFKFFKNGLFCLAMSYTYIKYKVSRHKTDRVLEDPIFRGFFRYISKSNKNRQTCIYMNRQIFLIPTTPSFNFFGSELQFFFYWQTPFFPTLPFFFTKFATPATVV